MGKEWAYPQGVDYRPQTFAKLVEEAGLSFRRFGWKHKSKKRVGRYSESGKRESSRGNQGLFRNEKDARQVGVKQTLQSRREELQDSPQIRI